MRITKIDLLIYKSPRFTNIKNSCILDNGKTFDVYTLSEYGKPRSKMLVLRDKLGKLIKDKIVLFQNKIK